MKRAIVTGANGFVGSAVCKSLVEHGVDVIAVVRSRESDISRISNLPNISIEYCPMDSYLLLEDRLQNNVDIFYHFAWDGSSGTKRSDYNIQLENVRNSCDALYLCKKMHCNRFVFASSIMEYELSNNLNNGIIPSASAIYSASKLEASICLKIIANSLGIDYIQGIISNIYGPGEKSSRLINTTIRKLLAAEHCSFTDGHQQYDFIYISDAAEMFYYIGLLGARNKPYYIGNPRQKKLKMFLQELVDISGSCSSIGFGEIKTDGREIPFNLLNTCSVGEDTGYIPKIDFKTGILNTIKWIKENDFV